jgi:2-oxoglutarate ferredoxin oxidoreductase subunit alpha
MVSLTFKGFDLADKYRMTSMILADGILGQMMEPVSLDMGEVKQYDKPWAATGTKGGRKHNIVNSLFLQPDELERINIERYARYAVVEENEAMAEEYLTEDAEVVVVAYGASARISKNAINAARAQGIKVGLVRPITLWPFPKKTLKNIAERAKAFIAVELSMGQMIEDVELAIRCMRPVLLCSRTGGMVMTPDEVMKKIVEANEIGGAAK